MSPLLTVVVVVRDLLPQGQKEGEGTILDLGDEMKMCVVEEEVGIGEGMNLDLRDEMKMCVVEKEVGMGVGKEIEDMSVVVAKRIKLFRFLFFYQVDFSTSSKFDLGI